MLQVAVGTGDRWGMKETVLVVVRGCPVAGCLYLSWGGRLLCAMYHRFTRFTSVRHTHRACAGVGELRRVQYAGPMQKYKMKCLQLAMVPLTLEEKA